MNTNTSIREATHEWLSRFNNVPGRLFEKMVKVDESISCYDSDSLRLLASPRIACGGCDANYDDDLSLDELQERFKQGNGISCEYCEYNDGDDWRQGYPEYAFPCGWGTLFGPECNLDIDWCIENAEAIAKLGIFVFESEEWGVLLGIDAGGFDFYEAYWIPLYKLRGLQWHDVE